LFIGPGEGTHAVHGWEGSPPPLLTREYPFGTLVTWEQRFSRHSHLLFGNLVVAGSVPESWGG
jgi:hypothetical protein